MKAAPFFKVLETRSCEVYRAKIAKIGNKNHMPDFFILFFYATLCCCSVLSDATILYGLFGSGEIGFFVVYVLLFLVRIILEVYMEEKSPSDYIPESIRRTKLQLIFYFCGAGSLVICRKILLETYSSQRPAVKRSTIIQNLSFRIFHISKDNIHFIKMYFLIISVLKSLPQLMITPILIEDFSPNEATRIAMMISTLLNVCIISATVSFIFPIRDTPRVYRNHTCVVFEAISKFLACACACLVYLTVFTLIHSRIHEVGLTVYLFKFLIWLWPCWRSMKFQQISKFYFGIHLTLITLISSIIYIHPFKGHGKLFYYPFYLIHFLFEVAYIYLTGDPQFEILSYFFTLKIMMLSFLSAFALVNVIHKKDQDNILRSSITSDRQEGEGTGEAEVWHWREHI